jgi:hypothetical protein
VTHAGSQHGGGLRFGVGPGGLADWISRARYSSCFGNEQIALDQVTTTLEDLLEGELVTKGKQNNKLAKSPRVN